MPQIVEAYGQRLEFPDGMPHVDIAKAIKANELKLKRAAGADPTEGMSTTDRVLSSIGGGMTSVVRALGGGALAEKMGLPGTKEEADSLDAPLAATTSGKVGRVVGQAAMALPAAFIPGANTYAGAALIGGATGGAFTEGDILDRMKGAMFGAAGGAAGKVLGDGLGAGARWLGGKLQTGRQAAQVANAQKDAAALAAQQAGYRLPPADVRSSVLNEALGGMSGKIKTAQQASAMNQPTTNALARQALGIADDAPLNAATLQASRNAAAASGYAPIRAAGEITADGTYSKALDAIASQYQGAARSFPGAAKNPVMDMVEGLRQGKFDAGDALDMVKVLRESADKAYRAGDTGLGKASKSAAGALEDQIERHLSANGNAASIAAFKQARKEIAKTYSVQKALNESTGDVSAQALAKQLSKGSPLSGELRQIAEIAQAFPKATQALKEAPKAWSPLDMVTGGAGVGMGSPGLLAMAAGRPVARSLLLSKPYQSLFATPQSYQRGLLEAALPALEHEGIPLGLMLSGGLLSANAAQK